MASSSLSRSLSVWRKIGLITSVMLLFYFFNQTLEERLVMFALGRSHPQVQYLFSLIPNWIASWRADRFGLPGWLDWSPTQMLIRYKVRLDIRDALARMNEQQLLAMNFWTWVISVSALPRGTFCVRFWGMSRGWFSSPIQLQTFSRSCPC